MSTFAQIRTKVEARLGRGSSVRTMVEDAIRACGLRTERARNFQPMHRFVSFTIDADAAEPRALPLPSRVKKFNFIRIIKSDGTYHRLDRIDPKEAAAPEEAISNGYWVDALDYLWLDNTPDQDYSAEMDYWQLTDWDAVDDNETPWLFTYAPDFVLYDSLVILAPDTRQNQNTLSGWTANRNDAWAGLEQLQFDWEFGGEADNRMEFLPTNYNTDQYHG